jgi:hypothetical protein
VKHRYQINRYCKLLNKQKLINGCWKLHFDKILLTYCKYKSLIWIYRWTRCATRWQPAQFRRVGSLRWNRTWVGSSGLLTTQTANLATVRFGPGTVANTTCIASCITLHLIRLYPELHCLSFRTVNLTHQLHDSLWSDAIVWILTDRVVVYLLTRFLQASSQNHCLSQFGFLFRVMGGGVLMLRPLSSSSAF